MRSLSFKWGSLLFDLLLVSGADFEPEGVRILIGEEALKGEVALDVLGGEEDEAGGATAA